MGRIKGYEALLKSIKGKSDVTKPLYFEI